MKDGYGPRYIAKTLHMSESGTKKHMTRIRGGACGWLLSFDVCRVGSCKSHPGADAAEGGGAGAVAVGVAGAVLERKRSSTWLEAWLV